jgi:F0F1-type ATP synthase delta subunit
VLPGQLRQEIQAGWLDELIRNGLTQVDRFKAQEGMTEVKVVSAFPLNSAQRDLLRERLKEHLGRDLPLSEATDERLVAGLTITIGNLVLDGSLSSTIRQAAQHAQHRS